MKTGIQQSQFAILLRALSFSGKKLFFPWVLPMLAFIILVNVININSYGLSYILEFNSKYLNIVWGLTVICLPWIIVTILLSISVYKKMKIIFNNGGSIDNEIMDKIFSDVLQNR
jgi:hypothetical protein